MAKKSYIKINRTAKGDASYNVYKFINEKDIPDDIGEYVNLKPYIVLNETQEGTREQVVNNYNPFILEDDVSGFISISTPFDIFYDNVSEITIRFDKDTKNKYITIKHQGEDIIEFYYYSQDEDEFTEYNVVTIRNYAYIKNGSTILISKELCKDVTNITLDFTLLQISFIDNYDNHGVTTPSYNEIEMINSWVLKPKTNNIGNIYTYCCIAKYPTGEYSLVSNKSSVMLIERLEDMETSCQYSDLENPTDDDYIEYDRIKSSDDIVISKDKMYNKNVPTFTPNEIHFNDSNVRYYSRRTIILPNIWHKDYLHLHKRKLNHYRFVHTFLTDVSYSDFKFYKKEYKDINIDMVRVYKRDVTSMSSDDRYKAISEKSHSNIIKTLVRVNGIFFEDEVLDSDNKEFYHSLSNKSLVTFEDHCIEGSVYNYTIYLYDEKGNVSKPIVKVG